MVRNQFFRAQVIADTTAPVTHDAGRTLAFPARSSIIFPTVIRDGNP